MQLWNHHSHWWKMTLPLFQRWHTSLCLRISKLKVVDTLGCQVSAHTSSLCFTKRQFLEGTFSWLQTLLLENTSKTVSLSKLKAKFSRVALFFNFSISFVIICYLKPLCYIFLMYAYSQRMGAPEFHSSFFHYIYHSA